MWKHRSSAPSGPLPKKSDTPNFLLVCTYFGTFLHRRSSWGLSTLRLFCLAFDDANISWWRFDIKKCLWRITIERVKKDLEGKCFWLMHPNAHFSNNLAICIWTRSLYSLPNWVSLSVVSPLGELTSESESGSDDRFFTSISDSEADETPFKLKWFRSIGDKSCVWWALQDAT